MQNDRNVIKHPLLKSFFTAFILFLIGISPLLIMSKGVYLWTGDYNVQTIVFTERISRMIHSGQGFPVYDMGSFLGMDFLTAYGDHLFSPFDWIMYAFPTSVMPYIHSLVLALKVGLAAVTAYIYCRQYVSADRSAFICGMLYAFSGYQLFGLVYQFSDLYMIFPILLYSFDQLVTKKRPFCFAAFLGIYCLMNSVFAWMTCLFLLIYYIVRTATRSFPRLDLRLFLRLAVETAGGVLMGAMTMLPFYLVLSGNTRAGNTIFGHSLIAYDNPGALLAIVRSMFFPPALCGNDWYFRERQLGISPPLLYIPFFLMLGVLVIFKSEKRSWYSVLLKVCIAFACVPVLNSSFAVFNDLYYARWFFMPLLVMIMMTGRYIDNIEEMKPKKELLICAVAVGFLVVYGIYAVFAEKPKAVASEMWIIYAAFSLMGMLFLYLLHYPRKEIRYISVGNIGRIACLFCVLPYLGISFYFVQDCGFERIQNLKDMMWNDFEPIKTDDDEFFRTSSCLSLDPNRAMTWDLPSVNGFNSMITGDTCDFFEKAGNKCSQIFDCYDDDYALCSFLSVKYDLYYNTPLTGGIEVEPEDLQKYIEGFEQDKVIDHYVLYKNKAFIPMGFTYDNYIRIENKNEPEDDGTLMGAESKGSKKEEIKELYEKKTDRHKLLLKAIWLTDEQAEKYGDILEELPDEKYDDISLDTYYQDCRDRAASACYEFVPDKTGFNARIDLPKDNLVFFSVPYNKYFTAYVDGTPTEIERVFDGLSAVYVPQGDHSISFEYRQPGFKTGCMISAGAAGMVIVYTAVDLILRRRARKRDRNNNKTAASE